MSKHSVLITGAMGGIGHILCKAFAKQGWSVIATDITPPNKGGLGSHYIQCNLENLLRDQAEMAGFKRGVLEVCASAPLKAIINNAAVQTLGPTETLSAQDILSSLAVNVAAPFLLVQQFLAELTQAKGCVLNIGSVHAQATKPEFAAYATSKTALHGLTRALAVDLGPRVRVNTLAPAATATPMLLAGFEGKEDSLAQLAQMHPVGHIADPQEISNIATFLCSDEASFITGSTFYADGGILSRLHDPD